MGNADLEYKAILEDRQKKIQRKIKELKRKEKGVFGSRNSIIIKGLEKEAEEIKKLIENYEDRVTFGDTFESGLESLNNMRSKREDKRIEYQNKINELKEIRAKLETTKSRRDVDKKIAHYNKKIKALQKSDVRFGKVQRTLMYPKSRYKLKKINMMARAEGRVAYYEDKIKDNEELKAMFKDNLIDTLKERVYDLKGLYYRKRLARSRAILADMQGEDSIVKYVGARITSIGKGRLYEMHENVNIDYVVTTEEEENAAAKNI